MKRIAITILIILVVLIGGALVAPQFMDWNAYRARIAEQVKTATGFELAIKGDLDLAVLPYPRLKASDISLRSPRSETPVLTLDGVSLNIAIMPLLSSRVEVDTLRLDQPELALKVLPDGSGNWMTDKLEDAGGNEAGEGEQASGSSNLSALYQRIGLKNVTIRNGGIRLIHSPSGSEYALKDFHAGIDAKTLFGPYNIDAQYHFQDSPLEASAKIGRYTSNQASLPLKLTLKAGESDAEFQYSGVADFDQDKPALQGEVTLTAGKLEELTSLAPVKVNLPPVLAGQSVTTKGMITSDTGQTGLEDMRLQIGPAQHQGHVKVDYNDTNVIRIDAKLLPERAENAKAPSNMLWKVLAHSGVEGEAVIKPSQYALRDTDLITGEERHAVQLSYDSPESEAKPTLDVSVDGALLDLDKLGLTASSQGKDSGDSADDAVKTADMGAPLSFLQDGVQVPLHIKGDIAFDGVQALGRRFEKPDMTFELRHNRLNIENFSMANAYNASWQLQGKVEDISKVSGIDIRASAETAQLDKFAKAWPGRHAENYQLGGEASARVTLEGGADALDVTGNLEAMKLRVESSGRIKNALSTPELASGSFRIRHPDSAELVRVISPDYQAPPVLKRPIDVYGDIAPANDDRRYKLEKLSGRILGTNIKGRLSGKLNENGKPDLQGDLEFTQLDLTGLMQAGTGDASQSSPEEEESSEEDSENEDVAFSRSGINLQALHALDINAELSGRKMTYAGWVLESPEFQLELAGGTLAVEKAGGTLFGGDLDLSGTIQAGAKKGQGMSLDIEAKAKDVAARRFSNTMIGSELNVLDGDVTIDSTLQTNGASPAALVQALNGEGSVTSSDFLINGIELNALAHALREDVSTQGAIDNLMQFMRSPFQGGKTRFTGINSEFDIEKGVISLKNTELEAKGFVMQSKGEIDLPRWKLDLMNTVSFPDEEDVPSFDIIVRGPLDEPARGLRDQMMRNYLEKRINNNARQFVTDKLNKLFGGDLKTGSDSDSQKQNRQDSGKEPDTSSGTSDANTGQDGDVQSGSGSDSGTDEADQNTQDQGGSDHTETISPEKMKDNSSGDGNSKLETIKPEDAVRGVIDRIKSSDE